MPKVFALHEVELPPDVTPEEYEQLFGKELASLPSYPGWKIYLLKGDRGEAAGKLLLLFEVESLEARDRYYPRPEEESEEAVSSRNNIQKRRLCGKSMQPLCPNLIVGPTTS